MAEKIKITFLGTADAIPSKTRNHSAIFLSYKNENILFDCGEGTQRQFRKAGISPAKVTKILISHWHGDHVLGIPGMLQTLSFSDYKKTLEIYGPSGTKKYMKEMLKTFVFDGRINFKVIELKNEGKFFSSGDFYLESKKMIHGAPCNAYNFVVNGKIRIDKEKLKKLSLGSGPHLSKLKLGKDIKYKGKNYKAKNLIYKESGKKISVVMDTRDNPKIVPFIKDADVLISECTYDSAASDFARNYKHMTSEQVGKNAKKAKVGKLVLTHISQRYQSDLKRLIKEAKKFFKDETILAKDLDVLEV